MKEDWNLKKTLMMIAACGALLVAGCSTIKTAASPVDMVSLQKAAFAARATYVAGLRLMAEAVQLPRCEKAPAPCIPQAVVNEMRKAELVADDATQKAENVVRDLKADPALVVIAVQAAANSASVFKNAAATYAKEK